MYESHLKYPVIENQVPCGHTDKFQSYRRKHHDKEHKLQKTDKFSCDQCGLQSTSDLYIKGHRKSVHLGETFSCNICPKYSGAIHQPCYLSVLIIMFGRKKPSQNNYRDVLNSHRSFSNIIKCSKIGFSLKTINDVKNSTEKNQ